MYSKYRKIEVTREGFDGIRKDNSKKIFYLLLSLIIIDCIYSIWFDST